ncbi:MAG: PIN domain-containing protein [Candidatus Aenigmarchaeota archaeon]|nr:PIN domain-containing protein [Candidatus Aenigmarchaeota archaeon]
MPTIVLCETLWLAEKGKIVVNVKEMLSRFEETSNFIIMPLDLEIAKRMAEIQKLELHDRAIVATAQIQDAIVLTKDEEIIKSGLVKTLW